MGAPGEPGVVTPKLIEGLNKGEVVVSDVGVTIPGVTTNSLSRFLLDLARAAAAGSLNPDKFSVAVRSAGVEATSEALGTDLADALWYVWQEVEDAGDEDAKMRVADTAKDLLKEQLVTKQQLLESGDGEFLEWCSLVVSKDVWRRKEIRSNTKHVYVQRKFNLLREESEGYAKLATLLNQQAAGGLTPTTTAATLAEMTALIGYFDLDPNRCISVVLDAFTQQPNNDAFLGLMPAFSADACAQVLGWHFFRCQEDTAVQPPQPAQPAPLGLYTVAAQMVQAGYCSLEGLMSHLSPSDEELQKAYTEGEKKMREGISRIGIISLVSAADTAGAPPLGAPPGLGLRREPSGAVAPAAPSAEPHQQPKSRSGQSAATLELAAVGYAAPLTSTLESSQKLLLLAAFLQIGDWKHGQALMRWLRALGLSDFGVFPPVGKALCVQLGRELQPVYAAATSAPFGGKQPVDLQLPPRIMELLGVVGQHLYHDMTVLTKLVRVLAAALAANGSTHPKDKRLHEQVLEVLTQSVLPAMSLVPGNAALVNEVWGALSQLPYTDRFCLYSDLKEGARDAPLLTAAAKLAETEVRRILRRVTAPASKKEAKATMKPLGRMLAKIMHAAPLPVAEQLIRQVMGMPGMVTSIVESLKYLTPMAFDVMTFAILKQLASPKKKLKDDGVNLEEWYQWLAAFTGVLCKKHAEVEVVALLQYVANQLKSSESLDLLVLREMVATMTGHQAVFEVSEPQLDALAGSDTLKAEVITQGEHRSSDKSLQRASARLLAALQQGEGKEQQLAMPLLVLLAQQRKLIVLQSQSTHLKLIAELYDKCQEVCTQYAEFLQHALGPADYAALLPSLEELALEYCIDPELIFSLYRPLIRGIEPPGPPPGPEHEEEGEIAENGGGGGEHGQREKGGNAAKGAKGTLADGAEAMEEDGQLEAGEVAASPAGKVKPASGGEAEHGANGLLEVATPSTVDAAQRWEDLERQVRAMHGGASSAPWRGMTPTLYLTFWALQLYDLEVPVARYEAAISQLRTDIRIAQGDIETAKRDAQRPPAHYGGSYGFGARGPPPSEVAMGPAVDVDQLQKDIERSQAALDKLPGELRAQQANAKKVEARLQRGKGSWVAEGAVARIEFPKEFVQHCVLPRMLNSPTDALYCARFIKRVHQLDAPGFNILAVINHVMREFGFLVRVCTAREATNFGIFLNEVFVMVERWRSADVFQRECATAETFKGYHKPAGKAKAGTAAAAGKPKAAGVSELGNAEGAAADAAEKGAVGPAGDQSAEGKEASKPAAQAGAFTAEAATTETAAAPAAVASPALPAPRNVGHREWLNLCFNWQKRLTEEVFSSCLTSRDYLQIKNALLALNRCVKVYPAAKADATALIDLLKPIRDKDPREDLKTLARSYCTALEMQMRDKTRNMVATREEYAGLPPKKRPRPAAPKAAAASEGKPPAAAGKEAAAAGDKTAAEGDKKGGGNGGAGGGKGSAAASPAAAAASAAKEEGKRGTADGSKGPSLPPGMGMARRGGEHPSSAKEPAKEKGADKEKAPEWERKEDKERDQRRQEGRGAAASDATPPGFGSADKLKHAGSTTELRRGAEQPPTAAEGERERRDKERERQQQERRTTGGGGGGAGAERPPRPIVRGEDAAAKGEQPREARDKAEAQGQERSSRGGASLRADAALFTPREGGRLSSGSTRPAEEPAGVERESKRARREEAAAAPAPAAAAGGREKDRGERGEERQRPVSRDADAARERESRSTRERPSPHDGPVAAAASAAAAAAGVEAGKEAAPGGREGREGRPSSTTRPRGKEEESARPAAAEVGAEAIADAGRQRERDARGDRLRGAPEQQPTPRERPSSSGREKEKQKEGSKVVAAAAAASQERPKRKRGEAAPVAPVSAPAAAAERPTSRTGESRERAQREQHAAERAQREPAGKEHGGRERRPAAEATDERSRSRRGAEAAAAPVVAAADVEDARAAAKAAAAAARDRSRLAPPAAAAADDKERQQPARPERRGSAATAAAAAFPVSAAEGAAKEDQGASSGSEDEHTRGGRRHKRERKEKDKDKDREKKKKDRKEKKHRRKDRSVEGQRSGSQRGGSEPASAPAPAPAEERRPAAAPVAERRAAAAGAPEARQPVAPLVLERRRPIPVPAPQQPRREEAATAANREEDERGSKRRRQDEEIVELPARLRGRLGTGGGLLGAALKGITQGDEREQDAPRRQQQLQQQESLDSRRLRRSGSGAGSGDLRAELLQQRGQGRGQREVEEMQEREVREVREVRDSREVRRGGRSRR